MRPLRLTINGLASFREEQHIDFTGLDLFVIIGPTGAGKTSILDAVALALYGKIPRTGNRNASELVSHGETRARVQLEFRANDRTYRVTRVLPRDGTQTAILDRHEDGSWRREVEGSGVTPVNAHIETIVGLDFVAFTRAVLLPQGEFARFLSGNAKDRREILMRLLELGRYESAGQLARQTAESLKADAESRERLIIQEYAGVTDEAVTTAAEAAVKSAAYAEAITNYGAEVERLAATLGDLERRLAAIGQDGVALRRIGDALSGVLEIWADFEPRAAEAGAALLRAKTALDDARALHQAADARLEDVRCSTGDEAELAALEQACGASAREIRARSELAVAIKAADQEIDHIERECSAAEAEVSDAKAREEEVRAVEADLRGQAEQVTQAVQRARERAAAEKNAAEAIVANCRWQAELKIRRAMLGQLEAAACGAEDRLKHLESEHAAARIRTGLIDGEPCPVCLHPVRSIPADQPGIADLISAATEDLRAARHKLSDGQSAYAEAESESRLAARGLSETQEALKQLLGASLLGEAEADAAALNARRETVKADREEVARLVNEATSKCGELAGRLAGARATRESRGREHTACEMRLREAEEKLERGFPAGIPQDAAEATGERKRSLEAARTAQTSARNAFEDARDAHDAAAAARERFERQATELNWRCAEQRGALGQVSAVRGIAPVRDVATPRDAVGDEVAVLWAWCEAVAAELDRLRTAAGKDKEDQTAALLCALATMGLSDAFGSLAEIRAKVKTAVNEAERAASRAADEAKGLEDRFARRREFEADIAEARERERLYRALAEELRQDRFIAYLLGESIDQLSIVASAELRGISGGRYGLIAEPSGFAVVDHANADETRSVDTLSGGETFLAALSLAMALARSITDIAGEAIGSRLEAMFIDEGFGTLDAETLDSVIDALESIRDSERLIGIITHVSQLADRIPDGLVVEREGTSSRVRPR